MKWRYMYYNDDDEWYSKPLPRRDYCKYCYKYRKVWYMYDDIVSSSTDFRVMEVCSKCDYHLSPIMLSLSAMEMDELLLAPQPLAPPPTTTRTTTTTDNGAKILKKRHNHGAILDTNGPIRDVITDVVMMPYWFKKGKPQY